MFGKRYFGARYYAPRYFGSGGDPVITAIIRSVLVSIRYRAGSALIRAYSGSASIQGSDDI